jgi:hypothetical protein
MDAKMSMLARKGAPHGLCMAPKNQVNKDLLAFVNTSTQRQLSLTFSQETPMFKTKNDLA